MVISRSSELVQGGAAKDPDTSIDDHAGNHTGAMMPMGSKILRRKRFPKEGQMDTPFDYATKQNIGRFHDLLLLEADATKTAKLQKLLTEEEDRLASRSDAIERIGRYIDDCDKRIKSQRALVAAWEREGRDASSAKVLLERLVKILAMYRQYRQTISAAIERNNL